MAGNEIIGCAYGTILEKKGKKAVVRNDLHSMDQDHHALEIEQDMGELFLLTEFRNRC